MAEAKPKHRSEAPLEEEKMETIVKYFSTLPRVAMLTIRGKKPAQQKIEFVIKRLKKISSNFVITRETNVVSAGYHFHALISITVPEVPRSWFMKGVHTHLEYLKKGKCSFPESREEEEEKNYHGESDPVIRLAMDVARKAAAKVRQLRNAVKHTSDAGRVLSYIFKDKPCMQYVDYVYVRQNKHHRIL